MMSSPIQPKTFTELLSFFKDQNLCVYPENPMGFIDYSAEGKATLQLYVAPKGESNIYSIYNKLIPSIPIEVKDQNSFNSLRDMHPCQHTIEEIFLAGSIAQVNFYWNFEIGTQERKIILLQEFQDENYTDIISTKKYYLNVMVTALASETIAKVFDPSLKFLKEQIDGSNYSGLKTVLLFHRADVATTAEGKNYFILLVGRFTYKGKDFIVIPSLKHSYRIVNVRKKKDSDPNFYAGHLYKMHMTELEGCGDFSW